MNVSVEDAPEGYSVAYLPGTSAYMHNACGAIVGDTQAHDAWHSPDSPDEDDEAAKLRAHIERAQRRISRSRRGLDGLW